MLYQALKVIAMFRPKLVDTIRGYNSSLLGRDLIAGLVVGIVALPLAIAFAIASGVSPEKGLYTAIIAGFIISALGGSRVQIGGPTGAFIVIVYGIVQQYGENGLIIATFMAGIMLVLMGVAGLGAVIRYIPYPLIVGFTSGIAVLIFSSQVKDLLGLNMGAVPADFLDKWYQFGLHITSMNWYALGVSLFTVVVIMLWPRVTHRIPGSLIALLLTTIIVTVARLPVATIGSRFGSIPSSLPHPAIPALDFTVIKKMVQPAFTIALLGGIESLLSAVVADGMTGGRHRSNTELIAQGFANVASSLFGGIPATGAIARTATNIRNDGRTPVAGMVHALVLLLIMLLAGKWALLIPMPALAGILAVVAWNMSEWHNFRSLLSGDRSDIAVLLITFLLTVMVDLTVAIEIGMVVAAFLFIRKMTQATYINPVLAGADTRDKPEDEPVLNRMEVPRGVEVFEISGPLFFGAAYKFKDALRLIEKTPRVLILRMGQVPVIDATGIKVIRDVYTEALGRHTRLILSEVNSQQVMEALRDARLLFAIGKANVTATFPQALERSKILLQ